MRIAPQLWTCLTLLLSSATLQACLEADNEARPEPQAAEAQPSPIGDQAGITAPIDTQSVNLDLNVVLNARAAGTPAPQVEPEEVRKALKASFCTGCHSTRSATAGLVLDTFPYTSVGGGLDGADAAKITQEIVARMTSTDAPMPPAPMAAAKAENIEILKRFAESLAAGDTSGAATPIKTVSFQVYLASDSLFMSPLQLVGDSYKLVKGVLLTPGQSYLFDLKVFGTDDQVLFEVNKGSLEVPADGRISLMYEI